MRRNILLALAAAGAWTAAGAQTVTWNDRMSETEWLRDAPDVRVILGTRSLKLGSSVGVSFEVSDNAYVAIVRVASDGKMTILYPHSRTQRPFVRAGRRHEIQNPRVGGTGFVATDNYGGYVFAIASYAPLDFSSFESRDFDRFGAFSAFTQANRAFARQPDVFIDRFAAQVLWDRDTPYGYDVDAYFADAAVTTFASANYYTLCAARFMGLATLRRWETIYGLDDVWDFVPNPYRQMCRDYYAGLQCVSYLALYSYGAYGCLPPYRDQQRGDIVISPIGGVPGGAPVPINEAVVRGGLFAPSPVPIPPDGEDSPKAERVVRLEETNPGATEWSDFKAIPKRASDRLKESWSRDASRPARDKVDAAAGFSNVGPSREKPTADRRDAVRREPPPSREPARTKSTGETRPRARPASDIGSTSRPETRGADTRITRPAPRPDPTTQPSTRPPTLTGSATKPTKPPEKPTTETKTKPPGN